MKEFELIHRYFIGRGPNRKDVIVGIGDDAAVLKVPDGKNLVVATDTMVEGTHFFQDASARSIGHKALVVNLSDFAAMGAEPAWASVALTLPTINEAWVEQFSQGLFDVAEYYGVQIVGGDTTKGPLSVTISLKGFVPEDRILKRSEAKAGDWIYVTGDLGRPALAVDYYKETKPLDSSNKEQVLEKFNFPNARLAAAQVIRHIATSAIDISDGLMQDLQHILTSSGVSAELYLDQLPISESLTNAISSEEAQRYALCGGEEYELLFTIPEEQRASLELNATAMGVTYTKIGQIKGGTSGITLLENGEKVSPQNYSGFEHFSD